MAWIVEFDQAAIRELDQLDRQHARKILTYLAERIATSEDPRAVLARPYAGIYRDFGNIALAITVSSVISRRKKYWFWCSGSATGARYMEDIE